MILEKASNNKCNIMQAKLQIRTSAYSSPLFKKCMKAVKSPPENPELNNNASQNFEDCNSIFIMVPGVSLEDNLPHSKFLCSAFIDEDKHFALIRMDGECLHRYLLSRSSMTQLPLMDESEIWVLIVCIIQAVYHIIKYNQEVTHLRQYTIRRCQQGRLFKLVHHPSITSQLQLCTSGQYSWDSLYLSPQQLGYLKTMKNSAVYSLGIMLLNICSHSLQNPGVYKQNKYQISEQIIEDKLKIAKIKYGYSKKLRKFIRHCLEAQWRKRWTWEQLQKWQKLGCRDMPSKQQIEEEDSPRVLEYRPKTFKTNVTNVEVLQNPKIKQLQQKMDKFQQIHEQNEQSPIRKLKLSLKTMGEENVALYLQKVGIEQESNQKPSDQIQFDKNQKQKQSQKQSSSVSLYRYEYSHSYQNEQRYETKQPDTVDQKEGNSRDNFEKKDKSKGEQNNQSISKLPILEMIKSNSNKNKAKKVVQLSADHKGRAGQKQKNINRKQKNQQMDVKEKQKKMEQKQNRKNQVRIKEEIVKKKQVERQNTTANTWQNQQEDTLFTMNQLTVPSLLTQIGTFMLSHCLLPLDQLIKQMSSKSLGIWTEGDIYYGELLDGYRSGLGLEIYSDGSYYYGYFKHDLYEGQGFYLWNERQYFFGNFSAGQMIWGRLEGNVRYQGTLKNNNRHGEGTCWYPSGQIYSGGWNEGRRHGFGFVMQIDGPRFVGSWQNGKRKGQGYLQTDKLRIAGNWEDQKIIDETLIEYCNGDAFKGKTNNKFEKISGEYISKGVIFSGCFQDNQPKQGRLIYKNGKIHQIHKKESRQRR